MRLMIVDDDRQIREGITYGIEWSNLGIEHAECFKNGIEALEAFRKEPYDIVLTDISMPGMSGIELMKEIKALSPMTEVLLISGYEEFEYARAAIKYGARDYILKPIHLDKVTEAIQEITAKAIDERKIHYMAAESEKTNGFQILLNHEKENGGCMQEEIRNYLWETCSFTDPGPFLVMLIEDDHRNGIFADQETDRQIRQRITEMYAGHRHCIILVDNNRELIVIHAPASTLYLLQLRNIGKRLKDEINESLSKNTSLSVSTSGVCEMKDLLKGYTVCLSMMQGRYFLGDRSFLSPDDQDNRSADREMLGGIYKKLTEELEKLTPEEYNDLCSKAEKELGRMERREIEEFIYFMVRDTASKNHVEEQLDDWTQMLRECDYFSEAVMLWKQKLGEIREKAGGLQGLSKDMREAILFIQKNYDKKITTEDVAEHLNMSSGHLSRLFRKELDESPKRYINLYRIRMAEHLLKTTNMKIYEVADQVGISDYKYFAQMFKTITGTKPLNIRKNTDDKEL